PPSLLRSAPYLLAIALRGRLGRLRRSDRALRSRLSPSRLYRLTFSRSTRSRLANPFHFPRANDLGMPWLVPFYLTRRRFGIVVTVTRLEKSSTIERA